MGSQSGLVGSHFSLVVCQSYLEGSQSGIEERQSCIVGSQSGLVGSHFSLVVCHYNIAGSSLV